MGQPFFIFLMKQTEGVTSDEKRKKRRNFIFLDSDTAGGVLSEASFVWFCFVLLISFRSYKLRRSLLPKAGTSAATAGKRGRAFCFSCQLLKGL